MRLWGVGGEAMGRVETHCIALEFSTIRSEAGVGFLDCISEYAGDENRCGAKSGRSRKSRECDRSVG
jgi:hypothetical protein